MILRARAATLKMVQEDKWPHFIREIHTQRCHLLLLTPTQRASDVIVVSGETMLRAIIFVSKQSALDESDQSNTRPPA